MKTSNAFVCFHSNIEDIVVMTMVPQRLFSHPWNATDDFFEEPQHGVVSDFLGCKPNAIFVYDRCGQLEGELKMFPKLQDLTYEW